MKKRLIINADDFGVSFDANRAIVKACQSDIVKSVSVMVNCEASEDAIGFLKQNPAFDAGLHVNLLRGRPVLKPGLVKSLVDKNGFFLGSLVIFSARFFCGLVSLREIEAEINAQIKRLLGQGIALTHIDSHMHLHMLPMLCPAVKKIAEENKVRFVRFCSGYSGNAVKSTRLKYLPLRLLVRHGDEEGPGRIDNFEGLDHTERLDETLLCDIIDSLSSGVSELMCHPREENELRGLVSFSLREKLVKNNIQLISFRDIDGT